MDKIKDANGKTLGYSKESGGDVKVYDANLKILGNTNSRGTFDRDGKKVLISNTPGFLIKNLFGK
jgi:hypothetical protein